MIGIVGIGIVSFAAIKAATVKPRYVAPVRAVEYSKRPVNPRFVRAAATNDLHTLKVMLSHGVSPDAVDGSTDGGVGEALQAAAANGNVAAVKLLLDSGADINAEDFWGGTALVSAAFSGQTKVVKLLLARGADVTASDDGATALGYAQHAGYTEVVKLLEEAGERY